MNGTPAVRILSFARTNRLAIVGSATRNATAIWVVDSPQTSRSVNATWASMSRLG